MTDISRQLAGLDPKKRRLVEAALRAQGVAVSQLPIEARTDAESAPLSAAQERLWILDRLDPGSAVYNEIYRAIVKADVEAGALERAWRGLCRRQSLLRSRFAPTGEGAELRFDGPEPPFEVRDLTADADPETAFKDFVQVIASTPFDLEHGPLARFVLVPLGERQCAFVMALHHAISDGASILILANELLALYGAEIDGSEPDLPELPIQYGDFARWQREVQSPELERQQLDYWVERLAGAPTVLPLPVDHPRPPVQSGRGETIEVQWPAPLEKRVKALARAHSATPNMVLLAAFGALLGRLTGHRDLLVGTPIDTRDRDELKSLVGFFVNTLALRLDLSGEPDTPAMIERVRETVLAAFDHKMAPFTKVVEEVAPERSAEHAPLVQVLFILQPAPAEVDESEGLGFAFQPVDNSTSKFDLTAVLRPVDGGYEVRLQFASDLFDRATMERFCGQFRTLLEAILEQPDNSIWRQPLLSKQELARRHRWNATEYDLIPADRTWIDLFDEQVAMTPDAPAVEGDPDEAQESLTYRQLAGRSRRLGHRLRQLGVGPEVPVGVACGHGTDMVVALLGILAAGGAYVPLDPGYPEDRLRYMVDSSGLGLILADDEARAALPATPAQVAVLRGDTLTLADDDGAASFADLPATSPGGSLDSDAMAYLIFTSGSTGQPKAVVVPNRCLVNLALNFVETFRLAAGERLLMMLSLSFDASVGDIFPPLIAGATVVLHRQPSSLGGSELWQTLESRRITVIELAAVFWQQWVDELSRRRGRVPSSLRTVVTGGDSADVEKVRAWFTMSDHPTRVLNNYGPTEATVCSAYLPVEPSRLETLNTSRLPIGRPMHNIEVHVLDDHGQLRPTHVPGELVIGGRGITRGYFGRAAATAASFVPDPFSGRPGARLYRTGDQVRRLTDGGLEFLGRIDHQAKIRGFRIEPGEVEVALVEHPAVREAVVKAVGDRPEDRRLVGYVVADSGAQAPDMAEVRSFLAERLPAHMVPSVIVPLDFLPMTTTGKVDYQSLPVPGSDSSQSQVHTPPSEGLESLIAGIWQEVLGVEQVGVDDNFFDLGGHSLLLLRVQGELEEALGQPVATADLFRFPTVRSLARRLSGETEAPAVVVRSTKASGRLGDIAIVGMSGRFPGAATVEQLWSNIQGGTDSISFFSEEELLESGATLAEIQHPDYVPAKGVIDDPADFDATFFGINPREAELIDPQQRLFLECAWEAIEGAGERPEDFSDIGVFAGIGREQYLLNNILSNPGLVQAAGQVPVFLGNNKDYVATRVSYKLDLRGPAMGVQTACSTSLTAVHEACRSLRNGDCSMALAGGVSISFPQKIGYQWADGGIFSIDGHTRAFDARAKGVVPGSGVGVVLLERLEDAVANGHPIRAVIRGTGVANDGADKVGFTAPGYRGQVEALNHALAEAEVDPETVGLIETHGTGTLLGDLIEGTALADVYDSSEPTAEPLAIGSIKTNLGHLDTAAGVAGLIKAALALERRILPPSLHFEELNPKLTFGNGRIYVNTECQEWTPREGVPRRAAVSSFGLGGTNVHAILEEAPSRPARPPAAPWQVLPLAARTQSALARTAENLAAHLEADPESDLGDVAHTLQSGRRRFAHRRVVVARDVDEARRQLASAGDAQLSGMAAETIPATVFLYPGNGAQYVDMGRSLDAQLPVFRQTFDRCAEIFRPLLNDVDLRALLFPADSAARREAEERITKSSFVQPALFATEVALTEVWRSYGVEPEALIGHSLGEYAAAHTAGVLDLEDACALVALRAMLLERLPEGTMLSVPFSEAELRSQLGDDLDIGAVNLPELSVASGPIAAIAALQDRLEREGFDVRRVPIDFAAHSREVEPILEEFRELAARVEQRPPKIPLMSNLTGTWVTAEDVADSEYWVRHLRQTVRFAEGTAALMTEPNRMFLEVGPGRTLSTFARRHPDFGEFHGTVQSLRHPRDEDDDLDFLHRGVGQLWLAGIEPDWQALSGHRSDRRRVPLPTYPFERRRFWIEPGAAGAEGPATSNSFVQVDPADWFYVSTWIRSQQMVTEVASPTAIWIAAEDQQATALRQAAKRRWPEATVCSTWKEAMAACLAEHDQALALVSATRSTDLALEALCTIATAERPEGLESRCVLALRNAARVLGDEDQDPAALALLEMTRAFDTATNFHVLDLDRQTADDTEVAAQRMTALADQGETGISAWRHGRFWREAQERLRLQNADASPTGPGPVLVAGGTAARTAGEAMAAHFEVPCLTVELADANAADWSLPTETAAAVVIGPEAESGTFSDGACDWLNLPAEWQSLLTVLESLPASTPRFLVSSLADRLQPADATRRAALGGLLAGVAGEGWLAVVWDDAAEDPVGDPRPCLDESRAAQAAARLLTARNHGLGDSLIVSTIDLDRRTERWLSAHPEDEASQPSGSSRYPRPDLKVAYVAPRTEDEELLCQIWSDLLGLDKVGIHDNFFDLGGDSVIALQAVARANQAGMQLNQRKTYHNQTIADLAVAARLDSKIHARQAPVTATAPLVAVQQWFFDRQLLDPHFWNLPVILSVAPDLDAAAVGRVARALVVYHDALRTVFQHRDDGAWEQRFGAPERAEEAFESEDLTLLPASERVAALESKAAELQAELDLEQGPLARFIYFDLGDLGEHGEGGGRLLMVFHHLVIDAVSLRILLGDLSEGLSAERAGREFNLPPKTTGIHYWSFRLPEWVRSGRIDDQIEFWTESLDRPIAPMPVDYPDGENLQGSTDAVSVALDTDCTRNLLRGLPQALGTEINDVLLAGLIEAYASWSDGDHLLLELEGHGREPLLEDADLTRTVGWLTSSFPLLLERCEERDAAKCIHTVRRRLREIPDGGMGWGMLYHLGQRPEVAERMAELPTPEIVFLYLGQFDQMVADDAPIGAATESMGTVRSPRDRRSHLLDISVRIAGGQLQAIFNFSKNLHERSTIESFASAYQDALERLVHEALEAQVVGRSR